MPDLDVSEHADIGQERTIMEREIGFSEALALTRANILPLTGETLPLHRLTGRVLAKDVVARVDSPSVDAALKDGYAVRSEDVQHAAGAAVTLELVGSAVAGGPAARRLERGQAIRVTTGAAVPSGADALLAEEFVEVAGSTVMCLNTAEPGRNILPCGADVHAGETVARAFARVTPSLVGLLATAGIDRVEVFGRPVVCVMATGDEVVAPGRPLPDGGLYASNVSEICAWLSAFRVPNRVCFAGDSLSATASVIEREIERAGAFVSSGGVWGSERDLVLTVLEQLGWRGIYHRIRMGPGKAVAFGLLRGRPFFCLPGGPPSNEMAFLQIALPGVLWMKGHTGPAFPLVSAELSEPVQGIREWTQFVHASLQKVDGRLVAVPLRRTSRLQAMAAKNALICIPEGYETLEAGTAVEVQVLDGRVLHAP